MKRVRNLLAPMHSAEETIADIESSKRFHPKAPQTFHRKQELMPVQPDQKTIKRLEEQIGFLLRTYQSEF